MVTLFPPPIPYELLWMEAGSPLWETLTTQDISQNYQYEVWGSDLLCGSVWTRDEIDLYIPVCMYRNRWWCCVIVCTKRLAWAQLTSDSNSNHSSSRVCLTLWVGHLQLFSSPNSPLRWASCNFLSLKCSQIFVITLVPITYYAYLLKVFCMN
jgi:hypothetical protein